MTSRTIGIKNRLLPPLAVDVVFEGGISGSPFKVEVGMG
jgi:hypothetical protein